MHLHCGLSAYHATQPQSCDARLDIHTPASAPYLDPTSPLQAPLALLACWPGQKVAVASHATLLWHSQSQINHSPQLHLVLAQLTHTCNNASMHDHKCVTTHMFMHHAHLSHACISVPDLHLSNDGQELRLFVSYCQICQPTFERPQYLIMLSLLSLHPQWFKQAIKTI